MGHRRQRRRRGAAGLRDVDEHQQGRGGLVQDRRHHPVPARHLPRRLLQRRRRAPDPVLAHAHHDEPGRVHNAVLHRAHRLRQLVDLRLLDRPEHVRVGPLLRADDAHRQQQHEPDPVRGTRRLEHVRRGRPDLRHDVAGVQQLRRQQPLHVRGRLPHGGSRRLQGGLRGLLQPPVHDHQRAFVVALGRVPDDPVPRGQRLQHELHLRPRHRHAWPPAQEPSRVHLQRPRRVLERQPARERRGGTRHRPQPRLLQRQRGVLEDALDARAPSTERPTARSSATRTRTSSSARTRSSGPAHGATRASPRSRRSARRTRSPAPRSS